MAKISEIKVAASYWLSANFTASTTVPINFDSKEFDTHNAVTPSATAWKFTAPVSGTYQVAVDGLYTGTAGGSYYKIYKNGVLYRVIAYVNNATNSFGNGTILIKLLAGESIDVRPTNQAHTVIGGALSGDGVGSISITKVGL